VTHLSGGSPHQKGVLSVIKPLTAGFLFLALLCVSDVHVIKYRVTSKEGEFNDISKSANVTILIWNLVFITRYIYIYMTSIDLVILYLQLDLTEKEANVHAEGNTMN